MQFKTKEERDQLILGFEKRAKELEEAKINDQKFDKNRNPKVIFDHRSEYDELEETESGEIKSCSGDIYVFFIHQPSLIESVKILDGGKPGEVYTKLFMAWESMIDKKESSPEVFRDRIKLGYLPKMLGHIDALLGDQKKS